MALIDTLTAMLEGGRDDALLRFGLGNEHLRLGRPAEAAGHLRQAVTFDPAYSAAWKLLGRALGEVGEPDAAAEAYRQGIAAAERRGDMQAVREMQVFLRRAERSAGGGD